MRQNLKKLAILSDKDIDKDFLQNVNVLCAYVYNNGPEKAIKTGETLNGSGKIFQCMCYSMCHILPVYYIIIIFLIDCIEICLPF